MTGRRAVLRALASAGMVATSPKVLSQRPSSSPRIGALWFASSSDPLTRKYFAIFRQRLRELGYVEGKTLFIEERFAEGKAERLNDFAREFVDAKVDIIVAPAVAAATAARRATDTIPIVMLHAGNPVGEPGAARWQCHGNCESGTRRQEARADARARSAHDQTRGSHQSEQCRRIPFRRGNE